MSPKRKSIFIIPIFLLFILSGCRGTSSQGENTKAVNMTNQEEVIRNYVDAVAHKDVSALEQLSVIPSELNISALRKKIFGTAKPENAELMSIGDAPEDILGGRFFGGFDYEELVVKELKFLDRSNQKEFGPLYLLLAKNANQQWKVEEVL